jgi:hypothetical protein
MTTLVIIGDIGCFTAGVIATLSWRKIKAWLAGQEAAATTAAQAEVTKVTADVKAKV